MICFTSVVYRFNRELSAPKYHSARAWWKFQQSSGGEGEALPVQQDKVIRPILRCFVVGKGNEINCIRSSRCQVGYFKVETESPGQRLDLYMIYNKRVNDRKRVVWLGHDWESCLNNSPASFPVASTKPWQNSMTGMGSIVSGCSRNGSYRSGSARIWAEVRRRR